MMRSLTSSFAIGLTLLLAHNASAGISYTGGTWTENFNTQLNEFDEFVGGLPRTSNPFLDPSIGALRTNGNGHIQSNSVNAPNGTITEEWPAVFPGGWKDDFATDANNLGVPGWYLHSDIATLTTATGGESTHAQVRYGGGAAASGTGFFVFSESLCGQCGEKALGIRSASAFTNSNAGRHSFIGLQLINDTGETLHSFTITYDGEQYSEAAGTSQDGFDLQWSLTATAENWYSSAIGGGFYNGTNGVDHDGIADSFLSPINNDPASAAHTQFVPGNRVADIEHEISGITWAPGAELWIRWRDMDAHDGIAIDNVRFTASVEGAPVGGDHNGDGVVDALDYVVWRIDPDGNDGDEGYEAWAANYQGAPVEVEGAGFGSAVPEPSTAVLILVGIGALASRRRRQLESL